MLPWETLRRLLGLPSDMEPPTSGELVRMALEQPRQARLIGMALAGHPPKEGAAGLVLGAHEAGRIDDAVAAELLGCVGHGAGYAAARTLLWSGEAQAAAPAGVAMARILGRRAAADLVIALSAAPTRHSREGAALGLAELEDGELAAWVAEGALNGWIRSRVAARCVIRLPFDPDLWLGYLTSETPRARRLGTEVVYALVRKEDDEAQVRLAALGPEGRRAIREALEDPALTMLPDKRDALASWLARHDD